MRDVGHSGLGYDAAHPGQYFIRVRVAGKTSQLDDLGIDRDFLPEHAQVPGTGGQRRAACSARLVAGQQDGVALIRAKRLQMVQYASSGQHAARRDDDHRALALVQGLRVLHGPDPDRQLVHGLAIFIGNVVLTVVAVVQIGGVDRHRTVEEDRNRRNLATLAQSRDMQHQPLRTPDSERRNNDDAAARDNPANDRADFRFGIDRGMIAVTIG